MAKPNYQFEKRQRDLAKKRKQEEKRQRKLAGKTGEGGADDASTPGEPDSVPETGPTPGSGTSSG